MKKAITYAIVLLLVTIVTVSGTYAIFTASSSEGDVTDIGTHQIQVRYSGDTEISGYIDLVKSKEEGFRRTVSIALGEDSVQVVGNIYVHLSQIDEGFSSKALKWEIYELIDAEESSNTETESEESVQKTEKYIDDGTFEGYQSGEKVYMLKGIKLTEEPKEYAIYLWLNGHEASNEVVGAVLRGYIGAETEPFTATITE